MQMQKFLFYLFVNGLLCSASAVCLSLPSRASNWVQWRGPTADGVAARDSRPPLRWDTKTNVAWIADLPGEGSATPIIVGDQIFVLSAEQTNRKSPTAVANDERAKTNPDEFFYRFMVTCLDRNSGAIR